MPRLPRIEPDANLQGSGLSIGSAEAPGNAIAQVGADASSIGNDIVDKQVRLQQLNDRIQLSSQASLAIDNAARTEQQDPDFRSYPQRVDDAIQQIGTETLSNIKSPEVRAAVANDLTQRRETELIHARAFAREKEIDYGQSVFDQTLRDSRNRLAGLTGIQWDDEHSKIAGMAAAQVHAGLSTQDDMQKKMSQFYEGVTGDRARIDGILNPTQTVTDLVSGDKYNDLNPSQRLELAKGVLADQNARNEQAEKIRKQAIDSDATQYEADLVPGSPGYGTATLSRLVGLQQKYSKGGEPLSRETFERLYDLTLKPPQQLPSDPTTKANVDISVNSASPISMTALHALYQQGKINIGDYTDAAITLEKNNKSLQDKALTQANEYRTQVEKVITDEFSGDKAIHASAMKDLLAGSSLKDIEAKYQPVYKVSSGFTAARTAYDSAIQQERQWQQSYWGVHVGPNPKSPQVETKRNELLAAAKKAGKDHGPAPFGKPEGSAIIGADGNSYVVVGGRTIAQ